MIWAREVVGWVLVGLGLFAFCLMWELISPGDLGRASPIGAGIMMIAGCVIFWGGIHLLKVAIAARVVAREEKEEAPAPPPTRASNWRR